MTDTSGVFTGEDVITGQKKPPPSPPAAPPMSKGRRPRGVFKINGQSTAFIGWSVTNNTHFNADTWNAELECWNQPDNFGFAYWADTTDAVQIEILMGFLAASDDVSAAPASPTSLIAGQVDTVEIDPITGNLHISGRDLTAKLIDMKVTAKYPDAVSSFIVNDLCTQAGLTPQITTTTVPVGQLSDGAYASLSRDIPAWDIIVFLAQQEGFDAYVKGSTLYFGPPQADMDTSPFPVTISRNSSGGIVSNVIDPKLKRSLTLAGDISVTVISHSYQGGNSVKAIATRAGTKPTGSSAAKGSPNVQNYTIRRPNLTQAQAQQVANSELAELTKFEKLLDFSVEGDPTFSVRRMINLTGTGTSYDQKYYVKSIEQSYKFGSKYDMHVSAKNHPTLSDSAL